MADVSMKDRLPEEDDSEWEYEYHESEKETFYVTLDISSAASQFRPKQLRPATNATAPPPPPASDAPSEPPIDPLLQNLPHPTASLPPVSPTNGNNSETPTDRSNRIQILDLHTTDPLISYQNQLYSCTWTSTIGTDVLITSQPSNPPTSTPTPGPASTPPSEPAQPKACLLATTNIKLSARPIQAVPLPRTSVQPQSSPLHQHRQQFQNLNIDAFPSPARHQQATFLSRLMSIKAAKGEKDSVRTHISPRLQRSANAKNSEGQRTPMSIKRRGRNERAMGRRKVASVGPRDILPSIREPRGWERENSEGESGNADGRGAHEGNVAGQRSDLEGQAGKSEKRETGAEGNGDRDSWNDKLSEHLYEGSNGSGGMDVEMEGI